MINRIMGADCSHAGGARVTFDERDLTPERSQKVLNHSPGGFAWGYSGSGPAQLALAILLEAGVQRQQAIELHQVFKEEFIANLSQDLFVLNIDVEAWANQKLGIEAPA